MMFLAITLTAALAAAAPSQDGPGAPTVWYVDRTNPPPGTGTPADPFFSVSFAVSHSTVETGDTILVAPGIYTGEEIDFDGKNVEVRSLGGPGRTRLVAPPQFFPSEPHVVARIDSGETGVVLEGFTLSGGTGAYSFACVGFTEIVGGAIVVCGASARVQNCVFENNIAERGGSVFVKGGCLTLINSVFSGFGCSALGQAVYVDSSTATIEGCTFEDLRIAPEGTPVGRGAVIIDQSVAAVRNCTFERNATRLFGAHLWSRSSTVVVEDSIFGASTGYAGASVATLGGDLTLRGSVFRDGRSVSAPGAGLFGAGAEITVERCLFQSNAVLGAREGGAIALQNSDLTVRETRFLGNVSDRGGAIDLNLGSSALVERCEFIDNVAAGDGGAIAVTAGTLHAARSTFQGNVAGPSGVGGAIFGAIPSSGDLVRCTLHGNSAGIGGGASGRFQLTGSIAWGNSPTDLVQGCVAQDSIVGAPGGAVLQNVSAADPRFFGPADIHLLPGSPAIDALDLGYGLDPDGSRREMGARTFVPSYGGDLCDLDFSTPGCGSGPNSTLRTAVLVAVGSPVMGQERLIVAGTGFPSRQPAMLLASEAGAQTRLPGSSQPLCLGPPVYRLLSTTALTRADGTFAAVLPTLSGSFAGTLMAGDAWHVQAWFRDVGPSATGKPGTTSSSTSSSVIVFLQ